MGPRVIAISGSLRGSSVTKGVACLVAQDWVVDDLREVGLKTGQEVDVRHDQEAIPDVSPETPEMTNDCPCRRFLLAAVSMFRGSLIHRNRINALVTHISRKQWLLQLHLLLYRK